MSKEMGIIVLGAWMVLATQLGIPFHPLLSFLFIVTGITTAILGLLLRGETLTRRPGSTKHEGFVEHVPPEILPTPLVPHEEKERIQ